MFMKVHRFIHTRYCSKASINRLIKKVFRGSNEVHTEYSFIARVSRELGNKWKTGKARTRLLKWKNNIECFNSGILGAIE